MISLVTVFLSSSHFANCAGVTFVLLWELPVRRDDASGVDTREPSAERVREVERD